MSASDLDGATDRAARTGPYGTYWADPAGGNGRNGRELCGRSALCGAQRFIVLGHALRTSHVGDSAACVVKNILLLPALDTRLAQSIRFRPIRFRRICR